MTPLAGKRLLVVSENAELAELVAESAAQLGAEVQATTSGAGAYEALRREPPSLAVLDLPLPDAPGEELIAALRAAGVPAIGVSGVHRGPHAAEEARRIGAAEFFEKPFAVDGLIAAAARLLDAAVPPSPGTVDVTEALPLAEIVEDSADDGPILEPDEEIVSEPGPPPLPVGAHAAALPAPPPLRPPSPPRMEEEPSASGSTALAPPSPLPLPPPVAGGEGERAAPPAAEAPAVAEKAPAVETTVAPAAPSSAETTTAAPTSTAAPTAAPTQTEAITPTSNAAPTATPTSTAAPTQTEAPTPTSNAAPTATSTAAPTQTEASTFAAPPPPAAEPLAPPLPSPPPAVEPPPPRAAPVPPPSPSRAAFPPPPAAPRPAPPSRPARNPVPDGLAAPLPGAGRARGVRPEAPPRKTGDLARTSVPRLLVALHVAQATGALHLVRGGARKIVVVERGAAALAVSNVVAERLSSICVRRGVVAQEALDALRREHPDARTSELLAGAGLLPAERRAELVAGQIRAIVWSTFEWRDGTYAFEPARPPEGTLPLAIGMGDLVLQGLLRTATLEHLREELPAGAHLAPSPDPAFELYALALDPAQAKLLAVADGTKSVADLVRLSDLPERDALAFLAACRVMRVLDEVERVLASTRRMGFM